MRHGSYMVHVFFKRPTTKDHIQYLVNGLSFNIPSLSLRVNNATEFFNSDVILIEGDVVPNIVY